MTSTVKTPYDLIKKLKVNVKTDSVIVLKPNEGCAFYIPDMYHKAMKESENVPRHVWQTLLVAYLLAKAEPGNEIFDFMEKHRDAMISEWLLDDKDKQ